MTIQIDIPADLTANNIAAIFYMLNTILHSNIFNSFLHGIYTGVITITLWNIFTSKAQSNSRIIFTIIILLYLLSLVEFAIGWSTLYSGFIDHDIYFGSVYQELSSNSALAILGIGITSGIGTILSDSTLITKANHNSDLALLDGLGTVLENNAFSYSIVVPYSDCVAAITRGIAPTLIFERIAAGRAHPDNAWEESDNIEGSVISSLHFGSLSNDQSQSDSEGDVITSVTADSDLEAQLNEEGVSAVHF
ncbi:hypothetical protein ARMGADRAFT_1023267 [Armillaria gallica]|uniref:Uncharacterized protein n=1 Tax=Armillaria gallica TaxID=47427 RepID=A0A2H3E6V5_ARMGA|nr:hypothetical protein ARMGADRAFT_1023267 [Armillaria gallica]